MKISHEIWKGFARGLIFKGNRWQRPIILVRNTYLKSHTVAKEYPAEVQCSISFKDELSEHLLINLHHKLFANTKREKTESVP